VVGGRRGGGDCDEQGGNKGTTLFSGVDVLQLGADGAVQRVLGFQG